MQPSNLFRPSRVALACTLAATSVTAALAQTVEVEPDHLTEVKVSARRDAAQAARQQSSAAKIVVDRQELDKLDASSVIELLRKLPGTGAIADPGDRANRGRAPDRNMPRILVDGQSLPGGDRNPGAALRIPVELIERVEIVRNSTPEFPSMNGAGTINLILRGTPSSASTSVKAGYGRVNGQNSVRLEGFHGDRLDDLGYNLGFSLQGMPLTSRFEREATSLSAGSISEVRREQIREDGRDWNLSLTPRLQWERAPGEAVILSSMINVTQQDRQGDVSRLIRNAGVSSELDEEASDNKRISARLQGEWRNTKPGQGEWNARLTLQGEQEDSRQSVDTFGNSANLLRATLTDATRTESEIGGMLRHKRALGDDHVMTGAVELKGLRTEDRRTQAVDNVPRDLGGDARADIDERRLVAWVQDEWQLMPGHVLTPGVRWQSLHTSQVDASAMELERTHVAFEPSLHYLWQVSPQWNLRSSLGVSNRPVNARDLSPVTRLATGTNSVINPDRAGNAGLTPERNMSFDLGIERFLAGNAGTIGLTLFHRRIEDQILRLTTEEGGRWISRPFNVGNGVQQGGTFDMKWRLDAFDLPKTTLRGNASATFTHLDSVNELRMVGEGPRRSFNVGVDHDFTTLPVSLTVQYSHIGALTIEQGATTQQRQGARRQLDVSTAWNLDRQSRVRLAFNNVQQQVRTSTAQSYDANGKLTRIDQTRGFSFLSAMLSYETRW